MRADVPRRDLALLGAGIALAALVLVAALWSPHAALTGWLGAATAFSAAPAGAIVLVMMMRLIPGAWGEELRLTAEAATLLTPLTALVFVPVLVGLGAIYPWLGDARLTGFQRAWLTPLPFVLVSAAKFGAQFVLASRMRRRRATAATAAVGLIMLPLIISLAGVHWLESLDPKLASSAWGLQFLLREVLIAFAAILLLRLLTGRPPKRPGVLGGLLLTLLLLWAYFAFLPFFIAWSGDLPPSAGWYLARTGTGWPAAAWSFGALNGVPMLALLFAAVRTRRAWLTACSIAVLLGQVTEIAWIALPGTGGVGVVAYLAALAALSLVTAAALRLSLLYRVRARAPREARA